MRALRPAGSASGRGPWSVFCGVQQHLAERELLEEPLAHRVELHRRGDVLGRGWRRATLQLDAVPARDVPNREVDQYRVREAYVDPAGKRRDGRVRALDQPIVADGLDLLEVVRVGDRATGQVPDRWAGALDRALELADAVERQARWRAALGRAESGLALGDGIDRSGGWAGAGELQRDRVELDAGMQEERRPTSIV
jgi:hypothetical protein